MMAKNDTPQIDTTPETEPETPESEADDATDELIVKARSMNIKPYKPTEKPGVYDDQIATLIAVDVESGFQNSIEILVPADAVKKHKRYFSQSAAKKDKTARIVNGEEGVAQGDGGRLLEFVLEPKRHRKPAALTATASADTPEEAPSA